MDTPRKFNFIDLYFDLSGEIEDKSTRKLYPQGNYQSVIYANFRAADPANVMGVQFELANGQTIEERPMYYIGKKVNDGIEYHSWEFVLPDVIATTFRKDREVPLLIQFAEREITNFIGVFDEASDLPSSSAEEGDYAWVLDTEDVYGYVDAGDGTLEWEIQSELETYNQVFGSDTINVTVAKSLRVQRETVDIDTSELVLKALARTQADALKIDGNNATDDIDINGVTFNYNRNTDAIQGQEYDARVTSVNTQINNLGTGKYDKSGGEISGNVVIDGTTQMNNTLDMTNHKIINVQELDAVNVLIGDLNIQDNLDLKLSRNGTLPMTGNLNMNNNEIVNLAAIDGVNISQALTNVAGLVDGSVRAKKAETTDDGQGNANTAQAIKQTVDHVNQSVKDNATPQFEGVKLGDNTLTETKLDGYDSAKTHADITSGNPHGTAASDIAVNATGYTQPDEPLSTDDDTIQKALNSLYAHNHDAEYVKLSQLGIDSVEGENPITGVATLGVNGKVDPNQLPSYVDDIVEFETLAELQAASKSVGKIYVVTDDSTAANNTSYRYTASGSLVKFDHTSAEWGHITGQINLQTDIENALLTRALSEGSSITGETPTVKTSINDLDSALKTTNSNVSTNAGAISTNAGNISTNAGAIGTNAGAISDIVAGNTDITFSDPSDPAPESDETVLSSQTIKTAILEVQDNVDTVDGRVDDVVDGTTDIAFDKRETNLTSQNVENAIHEIYGQKGQQNGIATLDSSGRLPADQLTLNTVQFKGTFGSTASTRNGDLPDGSEGNEVIQGDFYIADEDGYESTVAGITFNNGDKALYDGTNWVKNDASDAVTSVNEKTGAVTLGAGDIAVNTDNFDGELNNTDNTIQKALDKLDDHDHTEADINDLDKYTQSEVDAFLADKLDVGALASSIILYPTTAASDVSGFNRLVTDVSALNYNTVAADVETPSINITQDDIDTDPNIDDGVLAGQLIADANLFIGNPGIINVPIVGNIRKTSNNPNALAQFYFKIFKRDESANEELLATSDLSKVVDSETYEEFNASALLNNGEFLETDRIVIRFYGISVGADNATYEFQFGGEKPVRALLNVPIQATLQAGRIAYDTTNSTLTETNLQGAMDELDVKLESNITTIRVESFDIVNVDNGDGTFTYQDANEDNQIGTIDAEGFYIFDLQVAGYYVNNNLVEVNINDDTHYYTSDGNQLREGDADSEGVSTSVKVKHSFSVNDEIDIRYYQGLNIAASAVGDGAVNFAKLDAELQDDITDVREASPSNGNETIVRRNASNEFQGILDGKFKTPRTIALAGDVTGQAQFDGSSGITINTVVSKQNFDGGSATTDFSPEDIIIEGGGA